MKTFDIIKEMLITNHSVLNEQWWRELGTEAGTKAAVDAAKLELKNLVSSLVHDGKKLTAAGIKNSKVYLEQLERLSQASAKKAGYGSWAKFLEKDPKGAADAIREVTNGMNEEILGAAKSMNKPIEGTLTIAKDDAKAATTKIGKTPAAEVDAFFKNVKENSRLSVNLQKVRGEAAKLKPQTLKQFESSMEKLSKLRNKGTGPQVGGKVKTGSGTVSGVKNGKGFLFTREQLASYPGEILHYVISAKGLKTLLGIGVTVGLIYWIYQSLNPNSLIVVTDENGNDIQDGNNEWAPCMQELIKSGEGVVTSTKSGEVSLTYTPTDEAEKTQYPKGLYFYSNGRVMDPATNKMGSWKCKGAMPVIAESQKISLMGLLNEQSSEIDMGTMESYVDTAVDDLDGFVDTDNLNSLLSILNSLKGKTFQGKDAIKEFLSLYKEDEGGDDFVADVNSVGVKTLGTKAIIAKRQILSLAQGGGNESSTTTTPDAKTGLSKIDITWDGEKKTDDGGGGDTPVVKKKSVNYHDCSNKDFPYEFGCIAPKISEIQACLGVTPQKGYFGPKTLAALKAKDFIDSSNTITKETYDKVAAICGGQENKQDGETKKRNLDTEPIKTISPKEIPSVKISGDLTKLPTIQPTDAMNGQKIYEALSSNYGDGTNPEYPYIFQEGGRIKYKGEGLPQETLNALNTYISSMGYYYMKGKPKEDYGYKYVWVKQ